jgi:four helix bundle protein
MTQSFLPPHGGYRRLLTYRKAEIIFDATVNFCRRFVDRRSRTTDQMIQAARSGKQNIAEASMASGTSEETEIKLTNVARASLEELMIDYQDFLRLRGLAEWPPDHPPDSPARGRLLGARRFAGEDDEGQAGRAERAPTTLTTPCPGSRGRGVVSVLGVPGVPS